MSVLQFGISHQHTPQDILGRFAFGANEQSKILLDIQAHSHIQEVFLVSTCNRLEVYAFVEAFHPALAGIADTLSIYSNTNAEEIYQHAQVKYAQAAIKHAFALTSGLDSAVIGEQQILAQWKAGYQLAQNMHTTGSALHRLAQSALRVGKKVRNETEIDRSGASLASLAIDHVYSLSPEPPRKAVIIGAGAMGSLAAAHVMRLGISAITVINRSEDKAQRLADSIKADSSVDARGYGFTHLTSSLHEADIVISCINAPDIIVHDEMFTFYNQRGASDSQRSYPVCVDLSFPATIRVENPHITVISLAEVMQLGGAHASQSAIAHAWKIVEQELAEFLAEERLVDVVPTVAALRKQAEKVIETEISRFDRRNRDISAHHRTEMITTVRRVVDKLLHVPTVRVKELAQHKNGDNYAKALQELFALDPHMPQALSSIKTKDDTHF